MWLTKIKKPFQIGLALVFIFLCGVIGEVAFNLPVLVKAGEKPYVQIESENITTKGLERKDDGWYVTGSEASITIELDKQYVSKFRYSYDFSQERELDVKMTVWHYTSYDILEAHEIEDVNNIIYTESIVNLRKTIERIEMELPEDSEGLIIRDITVDNRAVFSPLRFLFICAIPFLILTFLIFRDFFRNHVERTFLLISLTMGCLMIMALPSHRVGWDEEVHFGGAYSMSFIFSPQKDMIASPAIYELMHVTLPNWPDHIPLSMEEHIQEYKYYNSNGVYWNKDASDEWHHEPWKHRKNYFMYASQALMITIGRILRLPFAGVYMLGRLGNLLQYCIVLYFAIKKLKLGKHIMAVLYLMPTPLFLACVYSYDAGIMAYMALAFSLLLSEFLEKEKKIEYKKVILILAVFAAACLPKAVYAPMALLGVFLPKEKFKSKKDKWIIRGLFAAAFVILLAVMIVPMIATPDVITDERGGDTDSVGQLTYILSYPIAYAKILLHEIYTNMGAYLAGMPTLGYLGHLAESPCVWLISILTVFTVVTDTDREGKYFLTMKEKGIMGILLFGTICFIWTSMYIGFTQVGHQRIGGVQGRYYLPIMIPIYLLFNNKWIVNKIPERIYTMILMGSVSLIQLQTIYTVLIRNWF